MKKKLLIILGAGSSVEQGVPSVRDIDAKMAAWARKWAAETGYQDYFGKLWWAISKYYSEGDRRYRPGPDFEKVLGEMVALSHWMTPAPWGDTLRQTACGGCAPPDLEFPVDPFTEHAPYNATIAIEDQKDTLLAALARHMRAESLAIDRAGEPANRYKRLIDGLRESFDLGIYNLNYDTVGSALTDAVDATVAGAGVGAGMSNKLAVLGGGGGAGSVGVFAVCAGFASVLVEVVASFLAGTGVFDFDRASAWAAFAAASISALAWTSVFFN
jgi:hypothetical protein